MRSGILEKWDMEYDVVVVGWGMVGTVAAVTAYDDGAEVLIVEKMPDGGGNTRVCGGNIIIPSDRKIIDYLDTFSFKTVDREIIEVFVQYAMMIVQDVLVVLN